MAVTSSDSPPDRVARGSDLDASTGAGAEAAAGAGAHDTLAHEVKLLGALLGQIIAEQGGPELLELVERCRVRSIAFRELGDEAAEGALAAELDTLDVDAAESLANAFALYFQLVNLAEERDTVRRLGSAGRQGGPAEEGTPDAAVDWLLERGWSGVAVGELLSRMRITPVLTAHPTEARRRTMLTALRRCYRLLEQLDDRRLGPADEAEIRRRLREEISVLWRSSAVRRLAPTPIDEVRTAMTFFDETIFRVVPRVYRAFDRALDRSSEAAVARTTATAAGPGDDPLASDAGLTGTRPARVAAFLRWGSWIGGDRDGNPNVTAELTRQVPRIHADHLLHGYEAVATRLLATIASTCRGTKSSRPWRRGWRATPRSWPRRCADMAAAIRTNRTAVAWARSRSGCAGRGRLPDGRGGPISWSLRDSRSSWSPSSRRCSAAWSRTGCLASRTARFRTSLAGRDVRVPPRVAGAAPAFGGPRGGLVPCAARRTGRGPGRPNSSRA
jgi:phosphoenolpyruvate carboxylase